jgi:hypothetical protein
MPERVNSFAPIIRSVFLVFIATIAVHLVSPAQAQIACIEQPGQNAAEGTHWTAHYDRAKGRKCWFLVDANGRDVTAPPAQSGPAPTPSPVDSLSSQIGSWLGNLTGAAETAAAQVNASRGDAPQAPSSRLPRKPRGTGANAGKADNGARAEQKGDGEGRAAKHVSSPLTEPEREELFEEFLRWRENQHTISAPGTAPSSR